MTLIFLKDYMRNISRKKIAVPQFLKREVKENYTIFSQYSTGSCCANKTDRKSTTRGWGRRYELALLSEHLLQVRMSVFSPISTNLWAIKLKQKEWIRENAR